MRIIKLLFVCCLLLFTGCTSNLNNNDDSNNIITLINSFNRPADLIYNDYKNISVNSSDIGLSTLTIQIIFSQKDITIIPEYEQRSIIYSVSKTVDREKFNHFIDEARQINAESMEPRDFQELLVENNTFLWIYSTRGDLVLEDSLPSQEVNTHPLSYNVYFFDGKYFVDIKINNILKSEKDILIEQIKEYLNKYSNS